MAVLALLVIVGALVAAAAWVLATVARRDRQDGPPGPVDVTDRDVRPPAPGSEAASTADVPGSRRRRAARGKP